MKKLVQSKRLLIGLLYFVILVSSSILISSYFSSYIPKPIRLLYDQQGNLIGATPFSPVQVPPLGTNRIGESLFFLILEGAKYTIGLAFTISVLRIILGMIFSICYALYFIRFKNWINGAFQVFYYVPTTLMALILLLPVQYTESSIHNQLTSGQYLSYQIIILTIIVLPTLSVFLGEEIYSLLQQDFITSARLMGAGHWRILSKHLSPFMTQRVLIIFMEQFIQVLILFTHLGILQIFLGGQKFITMDLGMKPTSLSLSNEWSGLIGSNFNQMITSAPWIVLAPVIFFSLTILFSNLILQGMKQVLISEPVKTKDYEEVIEERFLSSNREELFSLAVRENCLSDSISQSEKSN